MSGYSQEKTFAVVAETRRRWTDVERGEIIAETEAAASVSSVARKHGIATSLVFRWRREAGLTRRRRASKQASAFVPVMLPAPPASTSVDRCVIEIELAGGSKLRVTGPVEVDMLKQVIAILEGR